jgi:predicted nucleic acid-binding protein
VKTAPFTLRVVDGMRIVLDTTVVVKRGASAALVGHAVVGNVTPLASTALWLEYQAVVMRSEHWVRPGFGPAEAGAYLRIIEQVCEPVDVRFRWRGYCFDPDDDMVIEAAVNGRAEAIATFNERDFMPGAALLGLKLRHPAAILAELRGQT